MAKTFLVSSDFWIQTTERAIKTGAQAILLAIGSSELFNLFTLDASTILGYFLGGVALSVLTSIATAGIGSKDSPSAV